jgi:hypothetical protein
MFLVVRLYRIGIVRNVGICEEKSLAQWSLIMLFGGSFVVDLLDGDGSPIWVEVNSGSYG